MTGRAAAGSVEVRGSGFGVADERGHRVGRGATAGGFEALVQELGDVGDLLIRQPGKRGHTALGASGADEAGHLLAARVGKDHQRTGEVRSTGTATRVDAVAEAALGFEHRLGAGDRGLVEPASAAAACCRRRSAATSAAGILRWRRGGRLRRGLTKKGRVASAFRRKAA